MSELNTIEGEFTVEEDLPAPTQGVAVVQRPVVGLDLTTDNKMAMAIKQIENALAYKEKVLELGVKTARTGAIMSQGGKPYFTEAECERLLALYGSGRIVVTQAPKRFDDEDGNFGYTAMVEVEHPLLGMFSGFGSAHSSDKFLGTKWGEGDRPLEKVDRHNIAQHSLTRAKGSAIRRMLGLDGLSWEQLEAWGHNRDDSGADIDYDKSKEKRSGNGSRQPLTSKGKRLFAIWKEREKKGKSIPRDMLLKYAQENYGFEGKDPFRGPDNMLFGLANAIESGHFDS